MSTTESTTSTLPTNDTLEARRNQSTNNTTSSNNFDSASSLQGNLENLSHFSSLLTSPNQGPLNFPLQSPLDSMFPSLQSAFPLTPTQQFMANDIFQSNGNALNHNQPPIIQPLQIMNSLHGDNNQMNQLNQGTVSNHDQFLLNQMLCNYLPTPAANDEAMDSLTFEQQLQNMMAIDGLLDLQQIPMNQLQTMASVQNQTMAQTAKMNNGLQGLQALDALQAVHGNSNGNGNANGIGIGPLHHQGISGAVVSEAAQPSPNMLSNDNQIKKEGLVGKSKQSRKRKIKQEVNDMGHSNTNREDNSGEPASKRRRGRKKKNCTSAVRDDLELLSERMRRRNDKLMGGKDTDSGFIGIRTSEGEIKVPLPAQIKTPYEMFGHACTDKIEDILQAKGRTRYVRGLSEKEKKDRRREQNRNAAARSRARKNAMISKVIQLHQENLGLRAHAAETIGVISRLKREVDELKRLKNPNS